MLGTGNIGRMDAATLQMVTKVLVVASSYIVASSCLIRFNKFLMHDDRFPYAMALTAIHMLVSFVMCLVYYMLSPSSFPGIANAAGQWKQLLGWFIPIGLSFAASLYTSNQAYLYCNVALLQFMKEGNVILTFLMSWLVGLQQMSKVKAVVIVWIVAGSSMAVSGDLNFVWIGFIFQMISQFAECARVVMGEIVLGGKLKLDPLSYTMFVAPTCLVVLIIGNAFAWDPKVIVAAGEWWHYLVPNALLAFVLNLIVATCIKELSAIGFILAGVSKDIVVVLFSCLAAGEAITRPQWFSFFATLTGVFCWSYLKVFPDRFQLAGKATEKSPLFAVSGGKV